MIQYNLPYIVVDLLINYNLMSIQELLVRPNLIILRTLLSLEAAK